MTAQSSSQGQPRYLDLGQWALSHLFRAKAVERPVRGQYLITDRGRRILTEHPAGLIEKDLRDLPDYVSPYQADASPTTSTTTPATSTTAEDAEAAKSPEEQILDGVERLHREIAAELLTRLYALTPEVFEQVVLDLIVAMGYGGTQGKATRTNSPTTAASTGSSTRTRWG